MSQIFDRLRHGQPQAAQPRESAPRGASGDAVLATLGYAPAGSRGSKKWGGRVLALAILAAAGWTAWTLISSWPVQSEQQLRSRPASAVPKPSAPSASRTSNTGSTAPVVSPPVTTPPARVPLDAEVAVTRPRPTSSIVPSPPVASPAPRMTSRLPSSPPTSSVRHRTPLSDRTTGTPSRIDPPVQGHPAPASQPSASTSAPPAAPSEPPQPPEPNDHASLAVYYHHAGDFENALVHYTALIKQNPLNAQAHNNLGLLYHQKQLFEDAARQFEQALSIAPAYESAHLNYGATLLLQGKADAAAAHFREVLQNDARNVDALVNLALAQKASAQPEQARQSLLHALNIAPRDPAAHYNLAVLFDEGGEAARAIEHYRNFLTYAGAEHAPRTADVRARLQALSSR